MQRLELKNSGESKRGKLPDAVKKQNIQPTDAQSDV